MDAVGTQDVSASEDAEALFNKCLQDNAAKSGETIGNTPVGNPAVTTNEINSNDDLLNRLNQL